MKRVLGLLSAALLLPLSGAALAQDAPVSSEVTAPAPAAPLAGTLLDAGAGTPLVIIVPGSGPTDRDGNNVLGVTGGSYKMLAEALAAKGISSVRIDKRGIKGSAAAAPDRGAVRIADFAADARSWVDTIRAARGLPCVWVLGHSEGGLVSMMAAEDPRGICGLLLVASVGRPFGTVLREQFTASPQLATGLDAGLAAIASLEAGQTVDVSGMSPAYQLVFSPRAQPYFIDLLAHDPGAAAAKVTVPVLIVQGQRDVQIGMADAETLKAAIPSAVLVEIPKMTHVLKPVETEDRASNLATYAASGLPLAEGLTDAIAGFVLAHSAD